MARPIIAHVLCGLALLAGTASAWAADEARPVTLRFEAVVGEKPFACGQSYDGIGLSKSTMTVADFRFYVSNLRLLKADGSEQVVTLTRDGLWQQEDVALVDFEDGTKGCANGTPETRAIVEGQVAPGDYTGVRFDIGIPFEKNHRDPTLQPSPLNLTRMFWNWNAGYKFLRVDLRSTGQPKGWVIHLGSTGCMPNASPTTVPVNCKSPNLLAVTLPAFDVASDTVRLDLAALLANSNIDEKFGETGPGCMSGPSDAECGPLFTQFGLPFGAAAAEPQRIFTRVAGHGATAASQP